MITQGSHNIFNFTSSLAYLLQAQNTLETLDHNFSPKTIFSYELYFFCPSVRPSICMQICSSDKTVNSQSSYRSLEHCFFQLLNSALAFCALIKSCLREFKGIGNLKNFGVGWFHNASKLHFSFSISIFIQLWKQEAFCSSLFFVLFLCLLALIVFFNSLG